MDIRINWRYKKNRINFKRLQKNYNKVQNLIKNAKYDAIKKFDQR